METERNERNCPFCAERILVAARKCRFCGSDVGGAGTPSPGGGTAPARLLLSRESQFTASVRDLRVIVDGAAVGTIGSGGTLELTVAPGSHDVRVAITTVGTMEGSCRVTVAPGETRRLHASFELGFLKNRLQLIELSGS